MVFDSAMAYCYITNSNVADDKSTESAVLPTEVFLFVDSRCSVSRFLPRLQWLHTYILYGLLAGGEASHVPARDLPRPGYLLRRLDKTCDLQ